MRQISASAVCVCGLPGSLSASLLIPVLCFSEANVSLLFYASITKSDDVPFLLHKHSHAHIIHAFTHCVCGVVHS